jgi:Peptidase family M28
MKRAGIMLAVSAILVAAPGAGSLGARGTTPAVTPADGVAVQPDVDPRIVALLNAISEDRMRQIIEKLTSFGTRNTLSAAESTTHGIGAARQWILDEFKRSSPKLQVSFDTHQIPQGGRITRPVELRNVIAILPGKSPRRIYVCGHYDSLNLGERGQLGNNTRTAPAGAGAAAGAGASAGMPAAGTTPLPTDYELVAPGANDDGSGTALTMELARVFAESGIEFDATLVFITVAGEEQGLIGSGAYAKQAAAEKVPIDAVFNNDIVGNITGGNGTIDSKSVRIYSEGPEDSPSRALARFAVRQAARYVPSQRVRPMARVDRFGRGSDHSSFNAAGYPAICFRESNENYSKQHSAKDTIEGVSFPYLAQNARVNAAGVAVMALAPPAPGVTSDRGAPLIGRQPSGYDAALHWTASPGAVAYRVFWRDAWTPDWQHELTIGNVTDFTLPNVSIDDYVFGVAALDAAGHESVISAYVTPPRRPTS